MYITCDMNLNGDLFIKCDEMPQYWGISEVPSSCLMTEPESVLSEYIVLLSHEAL